MNLQSLTKTYAGKLPPQEAGTLQKIDNTQRAVEIAMQMTWDKMSFGDTSVLVKPQEDLKFAAISKKSFSAEILDPKAHTRQLVNASAVQSNRLAGLAAGFGALTGLLMRALDRGKLPTFHNLTNRVSAAMDQAELQWGTVSVQQTTFSETTVRQDRFLLSPQLIVHNYSNTPLGQQTLDEKNAAIEKAKQYIVGL